MSIWKPYAEDRALDLSQAPVISEGQAVYSELYDLVACHQQEYGAHNSYPHPHDVSYTVPFGQLSSVSAVSRLENISSHRPHRAVSPTSLADEEIPGISEADLLSDDPDYQAFERNALQAMAVKNGGTLLSTYPRMRRSVLSTNHVAADEQYRKQRQRNNFAAKQSRDRRKLRDIRLSLKVKYLRNEMARLKAALNSTPCQRCHGQCGC